MYSIWAEPPSKSDVIESAGVSELSAALAAIKVSRAGTMPMNRCIDDRNRSRERQMRLIQQIAIFNFGLEGRSHCRQNG